LRHDLNREGKLIDSGGISGNFPRRSELGRKSVASVPGVERETAHYSTLPNSAISIKILRLPNVMIQSIIRGSGIAQTQATLPEASFRVLAKLRR